MILILFLSNILLAPKFTFGFNFGYYSPSLSEFNKWLKNQNKGSIEGDYTLGGHLGLKLAQFMADVSADYFSYRNSNKLTLIPIDISLNYTYMIIPFYLYAYGGTGYTLCQIKYQEQTKLNEKDTTLTLVNNTCCAIPVRLSIKFTTTKIFSAELLWGYRLVISPLKEPNIKTKEGENGKIIEKQVPINIHGQFIRLSINREFF